MLQKFFNNLSDKERKILYIAIPFVLFALYDRLLVAQALDSMSQIDEKIVRQEQTVKANLRYLQHKDQILKERENFDKYITTEMLENKDVNRNFLSAVESIAGETNINIVKSNPTETIQDEDFTKYFANIDATGTLEDMVSFMHRINTTEELLKVVRFKMTPKRGEEASVNASMSISKLVVQAGEETPQD